MARVPSRGRGEKAGAFLFVGLMLAVAQPLAGAVITVGGPCNLNAAIAAANTDSPVGGCPAGSGADVVRLTGSVELTVVDNDTDGPNGLPSVTTEITIEGGGFAVFRQIFATPPFRIFHVGSSGDLTLEDLQVAFGLTENARGGGIYNLGLLTLRNSLVNFNLARSVNPGIGGNGLRGGGIYTLGDTLRLYDSRVEGNRVDGGDWDFARGGGVGVASAATIEVVRSSISDNVAEATSLALGGGIHMSGGALTLVASTVSGNSAAAWRAVGGGIDARFIDQLTIRNSTFSGNSATLDLDPSECGGLCVSSPSVLGTIRHATFWGNSADTAAALSAGPGVTVSGTLFADSTGPHCDGSFVDGGGGNLADDLTCQPTIAGTLTGLDTVLADNGGPTRTHRLLPGSTAVDIAGSCGLGLDQRGAGRIAPCDAGAYEQIGCPLYERADETIDTALMESTCHTAILGPDLIVADSGSLDLSAGFLVTLDNGLRVDQGGSLSIDIDPLLLP